MAPFITLIPNPNSELDGPVARSWIGQAGVDSGGSEIFVSVDVAMSDLKALTLVNIVGIGDGDDGIVELETADTARRLAAQLLEAADIMDGSEPQRRTREVSPTAKMGVLLSMSRDKLE